MPTVNGRLKTPFEAQIAFFRRKLNVPTARWNDLWRSQHAHGFMVAGVARADLLGDIRRLVEQAQAGQSLDAFKREFGRLVDAAGWDPRGGKAWRARVIYDTNVRQAFNAGRYTQLKDPDMIAVRPYWMYQHSPESRVPRPLHLAWDKTVLRHDDPWWDTHMPMNGWGCKCRVRALSRRDIEREGLKILERGPDNGTREWIDKVTGEVHAIPNGIDPGFDYSVGAASASLPAATKFGEQVMRLPDAWRKIALDDAGRRADDYARDLQSRVIDPMWVELERVAANPDYRVLPRGQTTLFGFLRAGAVDALRTGRDRAGNAFNPPALNTATILISDSQALHAMRGVKGADAEIIRDALMTAPTWMAAADAVVLWDTLNATLIVARQLNDGRYIKLVIGVGHRMERTRSMRKADLPANRFITGGVVLRENLQQEQFQLLDGKL